MIDFIKLRILNPDIPQIRNNPLLHWNQLTSERTGEIKEYNAYTDGLTFQIINNEHLNVSGSLHKYWNSTKRREEQNYNDFTFSDLTGTVLELYERFGIPPGRAIIENIEYGVNIIPPIPVKEILRSVINHKGKPFNRKRSLSMNYLECEHRQYYVKFYDKGGQYRQGNILRFEVKTRKMESIRITRIKTLSDLTKHHYLQCLGIILTSTFNDLLFYDYTIPDTGIKARERLILTQGQNPGYWLEYKETNPDNYFKKRNRYKDLISS